MNERKQADERKNTAVTITKAAHKAMRLLALEREVPAQQLYQEAVDSYLAAPRRAAR